MRWIYVCFITLTIFSFPMKSSAQSYVEYCDAEYGRTGSNPVLGIYLCQFTAQDVNSIITQYRQLGVYDGWFSTNVGGGGYDESAVWITEDAPCAGDYCFIEDEFYYYLKYGSIIWYWSYVAATGYGQTYPVPPGMGWQPKANDAHYAFGVTYP